MSKTDLVTAIAVCLIILVFWYVFYYDDHYYVQAFDEHEYKVAKKSGAEESNMLAQTNHFIVELLRHLRSKYGDLEYSPTDEVAVTRNLLERYDQNVLQENIPTSIKYTSYVMNKGDEIAFCLRRKEDGQMHSFQDLQFVILHELAHLGIEEYGHIDYFWAAFEFLMREAELAGLYVPIDYSKKSISYCGVKVTYNPYFDSLSPFKTSSRFNF